MKVVLADDHAVVRKGIRAVLALVPGVEVVAEASDGREALALIEKHRPDLAVLDVTMPELNGLEPALTRLAGELLSQYKVVYARPESLIQPGKVRVSAGRPNLVVHGAPSRGENGA